MSAASPQTERSVRAGLHWSVKWSFISYMNALPDGASSATDGCHVEEGRGFWFEAAPSGVDGAQRFVGDLRFKGHQDMLYVRLADPELRVNDASGTLSVLDPSDERIDLAVCTIERADDAPTILHGVDVRLTGDGAELFGDVYREGQPLEDFWVVSSARPSPVPDHHQSPRSELEIGDAAR